MKKVTFDIDKFFKSPFVVNLTSSEVGAYLLLLFISAENKGYLRNDMEYIRKITRLPNNAWLKSKDKLLSKFILTDKGYYNDTMMKKVQSAMIISEKRKENGSIRKPKNEKHGISTQNAEIYTAQQNQPKSVASAKQILSINSAHAQKILAEKDEGKWHELQEYVQKNFSNLKKWENQLTYENCEVLLKKYSKELIISKLVKMEDDKSLIGKKTYVFITLQQWCENELKGKFYGKAK